MAKRSGCSCSSADCWPSHPLQPNRPWVSLWSPRSANLKPHRPRRAWWWRLVLQVSRYVSGLVFTVITMEIRVVCTGIFLSTYIWGYISDDIGRRRVLLYGNFASNALQFVLMFVTSVWLFNILNLLVGIRWVRALKRNLLQKFLIVIWIQCWRGVSSTLCISKRIQYTTTSRRGN